MYTLTVVRLHLITKCFENTEANNFMLQGDVEKELAHHKANFEQVEKFLAMKKGETKVIQIEDTNDNKLWFYYIAKVN